MKASSSVYIMVEMVDASFNGAVRLLICLIVSFTFLTVDPKPFDELDAEKTIYYKMETFSRST